MSIRQKLRVESEAFLLPSGSHQIEPLVVVDQHQKAGFCRQATPASVKAKKLLQTAWDNLEIQQARVAAAAEAAAGTPRMILNKDDFRDQVRKRQAKNVVSKHYHETNSVYKKTNLKKVTENLVLQTRDRNMTVRERRRSLEGPREEIDFNDGDEQPEPKAKRMRSISVGSRSKRVEKSSQEKSNTTSKRMRRSEKEDQREQEDRREQEEIERKISMFARAEEKAKQANKKKNKLEKDLKRRIQDKREKDVKRKREREQRARKIPSSQERLKRKEALDRLAIKREKSKEIGKHRNEPEKQINEESEPEQEDATDFENDDSYVELEVPKNRLAIQREKSKEIGKHRNEPEKQINEESEPEQEDATDFENDDSYIEMEVPKHRRAPATVSSKEKEKVKVRTEPLKSIILDNSPEENKPCVLQLVSHPRSSIPTIVDDSEFDILQEKLSMIHKGIPLPNNTAKASSSQSKKIVVQDSVSEPNSLDAGDVVIENAIEGTTRPMHEVIDLEDELKKENEEDGKNEAEEKSRRAELNMEPGILYMHRYLKFGSHMLEQTSRSLMIAKVYRKDVLQVDQDLPYASDYSNYRWQKMGEYLEHSIKFKASKEATSAEIKGTKSEI